MKLDIRIDIARCKAAVVGAEHGITPGDLKAIEPQVAAAHAIFVQERADREEMYEALAEFYGK